MGVLDKYSCDGQMDLFEYLKLKEDEEKDCSFSGHKCNKSNLWAVAETLDGIECEHVCCRNCNVKMLCGAHCNGADELCHCDEDCEKCGKWTSSRVSADGKKEIYSCFEAGKTVIKTIPCDWEPHNKESEYDVKFDDFKEHCTHNGWIKGEEDADGNKHSVTMCSYANGKKATYWSDWVPCTEENCEIVRKVKSNVKNSD